MNTGLHMNLLGQDIATLGLMLLLRHYCPSLEFLSCCPGKDLMDFHDKMDTCKWYKAQGLDLDEAWFQS